MDIYGAIVLFFALLVAAALQTAFLLGTMFALHKWGGERLGDSTYGKLDFTRVTSAAMTDLLLRIVIVIFATTISLHMVEFLAVGTFGTRAHALAVTLVLIVLEGAGIAAGLHLLIRTDTRRTGVLAAASLFFYVILYGMFIYRDYLTA